MPNLLSLGNNLNLQASCGTTLYSHPTTFHFLLAWSKPYCKRAHSCWLVTWGLMTEILTLVSWLVPGASGGQLYALCSSPVTCSQSGECWFSIFPLNEREQKRIYIFIFCNQKWIKSVPKGRKTKQNKKRTQQWLLPASTFKPTLAVLGLHIFLWGGCKLNRAAVNPGSRKKIN